MLTRPSAPILRGQPAAELGHGDSPADHLTRMQYQERSIFVVDKHAAGPNRTLVVRRALCTTGFDIDLVVNRAVVYRSLEKEGPYKPVVSCTSRA